MIGFYSGVGDPNLILCKQQTPGLATALIDLGGLFELDATPQFTAVSLAGEACASAFPGAIIFGVDPKNIVRGQARP